MKEKSRIDANLFNVIEDQYLTSTHLPLACLIIRAYFNDVVMQFLFLDPLFNYHVTFSLNGSLNLKSILILIYILVARAISIIFSSFIIH